MTGSGTITRLARGATDKPDLSVGLNTSFGGPESSVATVNFVSDLGNASTASLSSQATDFFGGVYRPGTRSVPVLIAHVGHPDVQALSIANSDPSDICSENLIASLACATATVGTVGTVTLDFITGGRAG